MNTAATMTQVSGDNRVAASNLAMGDLAQERASLLGLLATLFRAKPNKEMLLTLRSEALRDALCQAGIVLDEKFYTTDIDELTESLSVQFTSLFLLPGSLISPHESVQLKGGSGLLRGPETSRVAEFYQYVGFQLDNAIPMEPDHISIELEFLGHLNEEECIAWRAGQTDKALDALRYQNEFLSRHLGNWVSDFVEKIEEANRSSFYTQVAQMTRAFLNEQKSALPDQIAGLEAVYSNG
ncbi:TorD/DmsD family molecular chaperone [Sedimenticola thiotaurini]|uniref:Molecular chaperone TorD family protein n=1 Tax=Sedimenticola thiotaurini TaxID=1543721 RepID=A0A0F7JZH8_9GAMM|nr:molecular chaperone TorD family protein [Sedimenticola thiotaurini]AKH20038.1 hypothetical protein AAY24_06360 [Sedimenticola thiotaurini]